MKAETEESDEFAVTLDAYNSDLNLTIDTAGYHASPLTTEDFAFMWAGARATYGVTKGKICFEVKVTEHLDVSHLPEGEPCPHIVYVGFSIDSSSMQLGEEPLSYGYCGTGKILTNCQFKDFGPSFTEGDTILAVVNMDSDVVQMGFGKNGNFLGWAYEIENSDLLGKALYPHMLTKNCSFEVNFGQKEKPFFPLPDDVKDYIFIGCLPLEHRVHGTKPPATREDCEIMMMCGLPGAGKSVWAAEYSSKHPEKKYNILGTNNIIDKMKVMDLRRWQNCSRRWDALVQMATKCLNKLLEIGSKLKRNYILDQSNVFSNAQKRKMRNFEGYKRIAVVVVPTEEEYKRRCNKRYRGKGRGIPDEVILEMKGYFKLPEKDDIFDDVIYTELPQKCAENLVLYYNEEGRAAIGPPQKEFYSSGSDRGFDSKSGNFTSKKNNPSGRQHCDFGGHSRCGCNQDVYDDGKFHGNYGGGHGSSVRNYCFDYKGSRCDKTLGGHHCSVGISGSYDRGNRNFDGRHRKYRRERESCNDDRGSFERRVRGSYKDDRDGFDSRRSKYSNKHDSYDDRIYSAFNRKKAVNEQSQNIRRMKAGTGSDYHHTDKNSHGNYRPFNDFRFSSGNFGSNSSSCFGKVKENSKNDFSGRRGPGTDYESKNLSGKFSDSNFENETSLNSYNEELLNTGKQCDAFLEGLSHDRTRGDSHVYNSVLRNNKASFHNCGSDSSLSFHGGNHKGEQGVSSSYSGEYNYPRCSEKKQNFFTSDSDHSRQNTSSYALSSHESFTKEPIRGSDGSGFNSGSRSHGSGLCRGKTTCWSAEVATNYRQCGLTPVEYPVIQRTQPNWIPAENISRSAADMECSIKLGQ